MRVCLASSASLVYPIIPFSDGQHDRQDRQDAIGFAQHLKPASSEAGSEAWGWLDSLCAGFDVKLKQGHSCGAGVDLPRTSVVWVSVFVCSGVRPVQRCNPLQVQQEIGLFQDGGMLRCPIVCVIGAEIRSPGCMQLPNFPTGSAFLAIIHAGQLLALVSCVCM